jgi:hypothetical protein
MNNTIKTIKQKEEIEETNKAPPSLPTNKVVPSVQIILR